MPAYTLKLRFTPEARQTLLRLEKLRQQMEYELLWGKPMPKKTRRKMTKK